MCGACWPQWSFRSRFISFLTLFSGGSWQLAAPEQIQRVNKFADKRRPPQTFASPLSSKRVQEEKNTMRTAMALASLLLCSSMAFRLQGQPGMRLENAQTTCEARGGQEDGRYTVAVEKSETLAAAPLERINPSPNGAAIIHGSDRSDVAIRACIHATAPTDQEARSLASQIQISKGAGDIEPDGPRSERERHWSVSYEIWLPKQSNLDVKTVNGGIKIADVRGTIETSNVNGGVELLRLAGEVKSSTVNGGVKVELGGATWEGNGLSVSTTNGGIRFSVPESYSANVETSTVNGGIHCDFPISVQGRLEKHVSFQLGGGGPEIRTSTVNGGIHFSRGA
jgi:hypothetical protein